MTNGGFNIENDRFFCDYDHKFAAKANLWYQPLAQGTLTHSQSAFDSRCPLNPVSLSPLAQPQSKFVCDWSGQRWEANPDAAGR